MSDSLPIDEPALDDAGADRAVDAGPDARADGLDGAGGPVVNGSAGEATDGEAERDEPEAVPELQVGHEPETAFFEVPERMCQMLFVDVVLVLPSTHPVVVLQESDPPYREIRMPIGGPEGVAIGYAARQVHTPRPLTHELMTRVFEAFSLNLDQVRITSVEGRTFRGELVVSGPSGIRTIDCRPSDAIALALRQRLPVPIMASPAVLDAVGGDAAGQN